MIGLAFVLGLSSLAIGFAAGFLLSRRAKVTSPPPPEAPARSTADAIPLSASVDAVVAGLGTLLREATGLRVIALYSSRPDAGELDARWRDPSEYGLPLAAPSVLLLQLGRAQLVDVEELGRGLHPGLPPGHPDAVAKQVEVERLDEERRASEALHENPFELDDEALITSASPSSRIPEASARSGSIDAAKVAARVVALPWRGPFDWQGLVVARPAGGLDVRAFEWMEKAGEGIGERLAVFCEAADRPVDATSSEPTATATVAQSEVPIAVVEVVPEEDHSEARIRHAENRLAEVLQSPRREADLIRATVGLLAEGLATDRCYALELDGLRTKPIEHERRSEAAASAVGTDLGSEFLQAVRRVAAPTIRAVTLDADAAAEMIPEQARELLGPVSRLLLPIPEKGRVVLIFAAEWIDRAKRWSAADVAFAERVAVRASVARERLLQFEALAEQAAHERAEKEEIERSIEQLQALLSAVPEGLIGLDGDGAITFANRAASAMLGRLEFELMGRWIGEAAADLHGDSATWERVLTAKGLERLPGALVRLDGPLDVTVIPMTGSTVCDRLVCVAPSPVPSEGAASDEHAAPGVPSSVARDVAEPIGRLLGNLDLLAGGAYGDLTPPQEESLANALSIGTELRAKLNDVLRSKNPSS